MRAADADAPAHERCCPKHGERRTALETIRTTEVTQAFYEAPHRLLDSLSDIVEVLGESRPVVVAREVTKLHEEFLRGTASEVWHTLQARGEVRGEITLLVGKAASSELRTASPKLSVGERMKQIMSEEHVDEKAALKKVAKELGVSKSEAYREWQREK